MSDEVPVTAAPEGVRAEEASDPAGRPADRPWTALWVSALALPPLALLAAASWSGRWVRPGADDWCFLPAVRDDGVSGLVGKFYFDDNGRVANALLVGAYAKFQVAGHQWYPLVSGVLVLAVLWSVAVLALRRARLRTPRGLPLLLAALTAALFLFVTPNTYKTHFWPAASVSHTLPPVLACAALIPFLLARYRRGRAVALAVAVFMGAFLATLSEETAIVVVVVLVTALLLSGRLVSQAPTGSSSGAGVRRESPGRRPGPSSSSPHPARCGGGSGSARRPPPCSPPTPSPRRCARSPRSPSPWPRPGSTSARSRQAYCWGCCAAGRTGHRPARPRTGPCSPPPG